MDQSPEVLKEQGLDAFRRGDHEAALRAFAVAADAFAVADDEASRAEMFNNMGVVHRVCRDREAALQAFAKAESISAEIGDDNRRAQVVSNMADLYAVSGERDEAARYYSEGAALFAQAGDRARQSEVLRALSLLRLRQGWWLEAMVHMENSLEVRPRLGIGRRLFLWMIRFTLALIGRGGV